MSCFLRICLFANAFCGFFASIASGEALAGAFLQPAGEGQVIVKATAAQAGRVFDGSGRARRNPSWRKSEIEAYVEYGLTEWATLIASPSLMYFHAPASRPATYAGLSESEIGAKLRLLLYGPAVFSAQATLRSSGAVLGGGNRALAGRGGLRADARLLAGAGFDVYGFSGFVDAQIGYRTPLPGRAGEIHADLTAGIRPVERFLLMLQMFSTVSPQFQSHKAQASGVYDVTKAISVQLGVFATVAGRKAPLETGVVAALWVKF